MISVGSIDAGKGLGLGFGVGREMEETELEEGEACYQNDDDSTLDPDVALSYIDEKIQDVLGHFQKDFEGGVSAENLGSKFGGYGSFLPTYQRSPAWSHPRTPQKVQNHNASISPNNLHHEGGRCNSLVSSSSSVSSRLGPAALSVASMPALRAPSVSDLGKREASFSSTPVENKSDNPVDQKTLKVRIKVGSDNFSTRKNAEIYTGLGLDVSPSSSLEDSPTDIELSLEPHDSPDLSPTSIVKIMTLFPLHGSLLLSPLPDDLMCLTEKEMNDRESISVPMHKGSQESSVISQNGSDSGRSDRKVSGEKRLKPSEKKTSAMELKNDNSNHTQNVIGVPLKKETYVDTSTCYELVSNALKLPLLSNSYSDVDSAKGASRAVDVSRVSNNGVMREESSFYLAKDEPLEPVSGQENGWVPIPDGKSGSDRKVWEFKKEYDDDKSGYPGKGGNFKGEKIDVPSEMDSNLPKGRKGLNSELMDPQMQKTGQKAVSYESSDMKVAAWKEDSSSGCKRKSKGSQSHGPQAAEVPKNNLKVDISSASKSRKSSHANTCVSKSEVEDAKKDIGNTRDRYKEFFGDLELEQGDDETAGEEMPSANRLNNSPKIGKSICEVNSASKERLTGKDVNMPSTSEAYSRVASSVAPPTGNRTYSDPAAPVAPLVKEDWVCCDKCQKWRLLPFGTNPDSLPKMWLCSMLDWLPGMNRCSFSEEETTKALISLYQIPGAASEGQNSQQRNPGGISSAVLSVDAQHVDQNRQDISVKKKHGSKEVLSVTNQDSSAHIPNSKKKNPQSSVKSRSLNVENQSPKLIGVDFQHSGHSSGLVGQKHRHKKKEKNKQLENHSEGDTKNSKSRNKRETDQDFCNTSKKLKTNAVHHNDEDWKSDNGGVVLKVGHISSNGLLRKDRHKYDDGPKESKRDSKAFVRNPEDQTQINLDDGSFRMGKYVDRDVKKRKENEYQYSQLYSTSIASGEAVLDHRDFVEETSENNHRKETKARLSKSGGKEMSLSNGSGGTHKKAKSVKDQQPGPDIGNNLYHRSLDAIDSVKRDLGSVQLPVAATSSSSKVSGSHKNKANFQELRGSPVESVTSSPQRISNQDKFASSRKSMGVKDDSLDAGFFAMANPRECSYDKDNERSDLSDRVRKDENITINNHALVESSVPDCTDRDLVHMSNRKAEGEPAPSPEFATQHVIDSLQSAQNPLKSQISDQCYNEEREKGNRYHNGSRQLSGKGSSSRSKDKTRGNRSELKASDFSESIDHSPCDEKSKAGRSKSHEKIAACPEKGEKNVILKKNSTGYLLPESGKRESQENFGQRNGPDIMSSQDFKQIQPLDCNGERPSKRFSSDKTDRADVSGKGKSHSLPPLVRGQNETARLPQPVPGSHKENGGNNSSQDAAEGDDELKALKQIKKSEKQNGNQLINSSNLTPNGHKASDPEAPSPARRDSSSQAATNAVKEAKDLKHLADRLKNSGSNLESTGLYFQAALKFLYGASLLESGNSDNTKHGEMIQSMQMYSSTAKLCEFCAHEYEKSKDMAAAALAYKCVEVAYLRVIYSSHATASKDRHELQTALQIVPLGESPSSSASDVDNLNNPMTADKVALAKGVNSPQVPGNHVIAARSRPNFMRLLNFAQDVNFAMEASRKSRIAFTAANSRLDEIKYREGMPSVRKALDFNFQDVEGLLRLVKLAMEAISR